MDKSDYALQENMQRIKHKVIVMSGKGGVGKSTVCVNLAYYAALQGYKVGLVDVDIHGPSVAKMTGIEGKRIMSDADGKVLPIEAHANFHVISIASMLESPDDPIIWRGPAKMGAIKQFLADVEWPELDILFVDCPPGTGDEPLSVIQLIGDVTGAVIVTTPQQVSLLDVRKSINFAKKLSLPVLGIVENMSGFVCPHCDEEIDIFKKNGASDTAKDFGIEVLGNIPIDSNVVTASDDGKPFVYHYSKTKAGEAMNAIGDKLVSKLPEVAAKNNAGSDIKIVAMPIEDGKLNEHFGHAESFAFFTIKNSNVVKREDKTPPPHEHGVIPNWLYENKVDTIIVNGIGQGAIDILNQKKITVIRGVTPNAAEIVIEEFIADKLFDQDVSCNHNHGSHSCGGGGCGSH